MNKSSLHTYHESEQIEYDDFEEWDLLAYKLENGLSKLISSLEKKKESGTWNENTIVSESNSIYESYGIIVQ